MRKRDVINMALDYLGIDAVDSSTAVTAIAKRADRQYDVAAKYVLDQAEWLEAVTHTTLTAEAAGTNYWNDYWEYMYDVPSDCMKVLDLDLDDNARYIVEGDHIYTNYYNASTGINLRYLKDIAEETNNSLLYSDLVAEAIATRIAYSMAPIEKKGAFREIFNDVLVEAIAHNEERMRWKHGHKGKWWTDTDRFQTHREHDWNEG